MAEYVAVSAQEVAVNGNVILQTRQFKEITASNIVRVLES